MSILPPWPLLSAFLVASLAMALTPGPGVIYIVTRSVAQGRKSGLASVAGLALGNLCNALGATVGLAALFAASALAFTIFKYAGAAYLVYLGVQALRKPKSDSPGAVVTHASLSRVFRDGLFVGLFHPKTALFFAAFLPQFVTQEHTPVLESAVLGSLFVLIALVTDSMYAFGASWLAPRLAGRQSVGKAGRYLTGSTFIGLGVFTALSGAKK